MLWELSVVEQRYNAVMEVLKDGCTVTEVAERYGVSRQAEHRWLRRYQQAGLDGPWRIVPTGRVAAPSAGGIG